jgi:hypothetical protein
LVEQEFAFEVRQAADQIELEFWYPDRGNACGNRFRRQFEFAIRT